MCNQNFHFKDGLLYVENLFGLFSSGILEVASYKSALKGVISSSRFKIGPRTPLLVMYLSFGSGEAMVKLYCPKCMDVYTPKSSRHHHTDGAYFGTGFPHMLFMVHPEYRPKRPANQFVPRYYFILALIKDS